MTGRRFVIVKALGRGGFGTIYMAHYYGDGAFRKTVALKLLNPEVSGVPEVVARLRDEARMLGLLRHRAIVGVDRLTLVGTRWAVVMEYVEGADLAAILHAGSVPLGPALEIVAEVADALHVARTTIHPDGYQIQLQHRDIKPANIQLTPHGEVKVLDFGIARAVFSGRETETRTGVPGTLLYMSPERMEMVDGPEADIYALGSVLFEMLVGERLGRTFARPEPHAELCKRALERMQKRDVPDDVLPFVLAMLSFDPAERPTAEACSLWAMRLRTDRTGEWLRHWAARVVPSVMNARIAPVGDALSGKELFERTTGSPPTLDQPDLPAPAPNPASSHDTLVPGENRRRLNFWLFAFGGLAGFLLICAGAVDGLNRFLHMKQPLASLENTSAALGVGPVPGTEPVDGVAPPTETAPQGQEAAARPFTPEPAPSPETTTTLKPEQQKTKTPPTARRLTPSQDPAPSTPEVEPKEPCVSFTFALDGRDAKNLVSLRRSGSESLVRSCATPGSYDVLMDCGFGVSVAKVVFVRSDMKLISIDCSYSRCSCSSTSI